VKVAVIALGKMGLPVAAYYAHRGATVVGVDTDSAKIDQIRRGVSPIGREPGVDEHLSRLIEQEVLVASGSYEVIEDAEIVIVLVPLVTEKGVPNFTHLDSAVEEISVHVSEGATVIFETTVPVGITRNRYAPILRKVHPSVGVVFSPERVSSGRTWRDLDTYPKIVGGVDAASAEAARRFYSTYLPAEVKVVGSSEAAEMTKLAETTYRDINIAFANELARFSDEWDVDVLEVIDAANSQPYSHVHQPGVGVGGHCIPHYPYLLEASTSGSPLIRAARIVNEAMPQVVLGITKEHVGDLEGKDVVLLGAAYRPGVPEVTSSPVFALDTGLRTSGSRVWVDDPLFDDVALERFGLRPWHGEAPDAFILVTGHEIYQTFDWSRYHPAVVIDGRNSLDRHTVEAAGHRYVGLGR
jgi:nucleotide sugar dehydrogenase